MENVKCKMIGGVMENVKCKMIGDAWRRIRALPHFTFHTLHFTFFAVCCAACWGGVVERMEVPKAGVRSAAECGEATGPAKVWDFTKGALPTGCRLRKDGTHSERGVGSIAFTNSSSQGGCVIANGSTPQGAFLFEAEFEVGNYAAETKNAHVGRIWDDMGINYFPKRDNTGLEIGLRQEPDGYWFPQVVLGMGKGTYRLEGERRRFYQGAIAKLAVFFGANGRVVIDFNGLVGERQIPVCGSLAQSTQSWHLPVMVIAATAAAGAALFLCLWRTRASSYEAE